MIAILTHVSAFAAGCLLGWWFRRWWALREFDEQMSVAHRRGPIATSMPPDDRQAAIDVVTIAGLVVIGLAIVYVIAAERIAANVTGVWQ